MGELIVMTGSFIAIFAILICCITNAPDSSKDRYSRERARHRHHCQKCRKLK
jgi:hypothetical protein